MLFSWWKRRRRRRILSRPFPAAWTHILETQVGHYALLPEADRNRLRDLVQILLAEKSWEGCRGLELTDDMRVTVAALAAVLVLGLPEHLFDNVPTVLIYPNEYRVPQVESLTGEAILQGVDAHQGEAHRRGAVIVSWSVVREEAIDPGHGQNLVFHEFAHTLDMLNGEFDGVPDLPDRALRERWARVMAAEYERLRRSAQRRRSTFLDPYGANDPAEFFAVATESFFDEPTNLIECHPELYALLRDYYRQDPATWSWPSNEASQ